MGSITYIFFSCWPRSLGSVLILIHKSINPNPNLVSPVWGGLLKETLWMCHWLLLCVVLTLPLQELDDAFGTPRSAGPSIKLFRCREEPLAFPVWCSPPPQSWMLLQVSQLWDFFILLTLVLSSLVLQAVLAEQL